MSKALILGFVWFIQTHTPCVYAQTDTRSSEQLIKELKDQKDVLLNSKHQLEAFYLRLTSVQTASCLKEIQKIESENPAAFDVGAFSLIEDESKNLRTWKMTYYFGNNESGFNAHQMTLFIEEKIHIDSRANLDGGNRFFVERCHLVQDW